MADALDEASQSGNMPNDHPAPKSCLNPLRVKLPRLNAWPMAAQEYPQLQRWHWKKFHCDWHFCQWNWRLAAQDLMGQALPQWRDRTPTMFQLKKPKKLTASVPSLPRRLTPASQQKVPNIERLICLESAICEQLLLRSGKPLSATELPPF